MTPAAPAAAATGVAEAQFAARAAAVTRTGTSRPVAMANVGLSQAESVEFIRTNAYRAMQEVAHASRAQLASIYASGAGSHSHALAYYPGPRVAYYSGSRGSSSRDKHRRRRRGTAEAWGVDVRANGANGRPARRHPVPMPVTHRARRQAGVLGPGDTGFAALAGPSPGSTRLHPGWHSPPAAPGQKHDVHRFDG